jgi:CRISPR-associated endoribonuclease Cas6
LLADSKYRRLHDTKGYKFFSFSNVLPPKDLDRGSNRYLILASPDRDMVSTFVDGIDSVIGRGLPIRIGEMEFVIEDRLVLDTRLDDDWVVLRSGTPIVIRIPEKNYTEYGIRPAKDYKYLYWRSSFPLQAFLKQLEDNLLKKYGTYHDTEMESTAIFQGFKFLKQVSNRVRIREKEHILIGSLWEFRFGQLDNKIRNVLQFGMDTGFGEMNSLGFGFMNKSTQ